MYSSAIANLEKELAELKKDYGRLCQNDSVMRTESSVAFKRLDKQDEEIKELKLIITNLHQECQRLYQTGFSNGVEVARKEYADELKKLEDRGLISYHGFLKSESNEALDKLSEEMYNMLGVKKDDLQPLSATKIADEAWHKWILDESCKTLKEKTELHTCYHKICAGCKDLHLDSVNGSLERYTCKMKGITILTNTMPKPENFVEVFKKE